MSDFTANTALGTQSGTGGFAVVTKFIAGLSNGLQAHRAYMALNAKSDRQLADMGLTRQDVARAAAESIFE